MTNTTYTQKSYLIMSEHPEYAKLHAETTQEMEELVRRLRLAEEETA